MVFAIFGATGPGGVVVSGEGFGHIAFYERLVLMLGIDKVDDLGAI